MLNKDDMYCLTDKFSIYRVYGRDGQEIDFKTEYDIDTYMHTFRVPLGICKELKVRYNTKYNSYENVAITNDGMTLPVILQKGDNNMHTPRAPTTGQ